MRLFFKFLLFLSFSVHAAAPMAICYKKTTEESARKIKEILTQGFGLPVQLIDLDSGPCQENMAWALKLKATLNDFEVEHYDHESFHALFDVFLNENKEQNK